MDLQSQQVPEAMRAEGCRDALCDLFLGGQGHHAQFSQQLTQLAMHLEVQVDVVHPGREPCDQTLLQRLHALDQRAIERQRIIARPAARDVRGIAVHAGAGIHQQAVTGGGGLQSIMLVMQNRGMRVETDDVAVRHIRFPLARRAKIGQLDIELRAALHESAPGSQMATRGAQAGFFKTGDLEFALADASLVELAHQADRVGQCLKFADHLRLKLGDLAQQRRAALGTLWQCRLPQMDDLELLGPGRSVRRRQTR